MQRGNFWTIGRLAFFVAYQALLHLTLPLICLYFLYLSRRERVYRAQFWQRFGFVPRTQGRIWLYAASLGEVRAVAPVIRQLLTANEDVLVTVASPAGASEVKRLFGHSLTEGHVCLSWVPLDLFWAVAIFLRRTRPRIGATVEGELWPAQVVATHKKNIPFLTINGNLPERSVLRDQASWVGRQRLGFLQGMRMVLTKSPARVETYRKAGVPDERIKNVGELRLDQELRQDLIVAAKDIREKIAAKRRIVMIASSVKGEEDALLGIAERLTQLENPPFIVWAPRSPQRFSPLAEKLVDHGFAILQRSKNFSADFTPYNLPQSDILLGDSLGEMDFYYALADLVFVGATLVDHGGHNVTEPLLHHKPVITGPSTFGIPTPWSEAKLRGAVEQHANAKRVGDAMVKYLRNPQLLYEFAARTHGFLEQNKGAAQRTAHYLQTLEYQR